jgi:hypothetical protein
MESTPLIGLESLHAGVHRREVIRLPRGALMACLSPKEIPQEADGCCHTEISVSTQDQTLPRITALPDTFKFILIRLPGVKPTP